MPYLVYLSSVLNHKAIQWSTIQRDIEALSLCFMIFGVVYSQGEWHQAPHNRKHEGIRSFDAALSVASQILHLDNVAVVRVCRGVVTLPSLKPYVYGEVLAWCQVVHFSPQGSDVNNKCLAQQVASELELVANGVVSWQKACFVQFLCVPSAQYARIVPIAPQIPLLAGVGMPSRRRKAKGQEDEDVVPPLGSKLDVKFRFHIQLKINLGHSRR